MQFGEESFGEERYMTKHATWKTIQWQAKETPGATILYFMQPLTKYSFVVASEARKGSTERTAHCPTGSKGE
jgi:hypothetical protein